MTSIFLCFSLFYKNTEKLSKNERENINKRKIIFFTIFFRKVLNRNAYIGRILQLYNLRNSFYLMFIVHVINVYWLCHNMHAFTIRGRKLILNHECDKKRVVSSFIDKLDAVVISH